MALVALTPVPSFCSSTKNSAEGVSALTLGAICDSFAKQNRTIGRAGGAWQAETPIFQIINNISSSHHPPGATATYLAAIVLSRPIL